MDFELNDDERALQDGLRAFLQGRFPIDVVRSIEDAGGSPSRAQWAALAEVGVFSLRQDGFGCTDAVLAFEELGRALVPGPIVATHLAADATRIVGIVEPSQPVTMVEHLSMLDALIVLRDEGLFAVSPSSVLGTTVERPLDALTPVTAVFELPDGEQIAGPEVAQTWRLDGMVLTAAMQLGLCLASIELAREYAMQREQFGRPIGSFQAIKHLLADMLTRAEVARAAVYAAGVTFDGRADRTDEQQAARTAKIMAGDAALFCAKTCIQIHGGMGFTWEVDAQRYWKRACVLDTHFGNSDHHASAFADALSTGGHTNGHL